MEKLEEWSVNLFGLGMWVWGFSYLIIYLCRGEEMMSKEILTSMMEAMVDTFPVSKLKLMMWPGTF